MSTALVVVGITLVAGSVILWRRVSRRRATLAESATFAERAMTPDQIEIARLMQNVPADELYKKYGDGLRNMTEEQAARYRNFYWSMSHGSNVPQSIVNVVEEPTP